MGGDTVKAVVEAVTADGATKSPASFGAATIPTTLPVPDKPSTTISVYNLDVTWTTPPEEGGLITINRYDVKIQTSSSPI